MTNRPLTILVTAAALAVGAVALATVVAAGDDPGRSAGPALRPRTVEIPFADAAPASLTTAQLVERRRAEARAEPGPAAYVALALAELQMAREDGDPTWYPRAERLLEQARALAPGDAAATAALGSVALVRHDFVRALRLARAALRAEPEDPYALGVAADAQIELGRYPAARRAVQRMLDVRPDLSSYSRASYILELDGRVALARRALREAIRSGAPAAENTAWAHLYLGNLEFGQGRYAAAGREYRLARRIYPGFVHAEAAAARLAAARGERRRAIALLRDVVDRTPLPAYVIALGDLYTAAGRRAAAHAQYALAGAQARLFAASGVNVDVELALFAADHGGDAAAAARRLRALRRVQPSVVVDDALAWTLFRAGSPREALRYADRALRLGTRDAAFLYHRGAIEASLGLDRAARRDLRAALALNPHFSILGERDARRLLEELT